MKFSIERVKLHNKIIENAFIDKEKSDAPYYLLVCGGPAAGKSTLLRSFEQQGLFLDCTVVKINLHLFKILPEFEKYFGIMPHPEKTEELIHEFYYLVEKIIQKAAEGNYNILFDDHGDQAPQYIEHCKIYDSYNFTTAAIGAYRTEKSFYEKIENKIKQGRFAYTPDIHKQSIDLYNVFCKNWEPKIVPNFKGADLYFLDEAGHNLIASYKTEKSKTSKQIIDHQLYDVFLKNGQ